MDISSVIVRAVPDRLPEVRAALTKLPGVEVHADTGDGRLIVTIEDGDGYKPADVYSRLREIDGVLAVSLVYHHNDEPLQEEFPK
jgi:periplasmic nitrate reductase NapD